MKPKFNHPFTHRVAITQISQFNLAQPHTNARRAHLVAEPGKPFRERFRPVLTLVAKNVNDQRPVA
jgi:hypothetical protein